MPTKPKDDPFKLPSNFPPFVSGAEKRALATSGKPFTLTALERREINERPQWCADIILDDEKKCLTFSPSPGRDEAMEGIKAHLAKHGPRKNVALTVAGTNRENKSAFYVFCDAKDWRKPKELPKQRSN